MTNTIPTVGAGIELKPSPPLNGQAVTTPEFNREWDRVFARLEEIRAYEEDWDGEGSLAPRPGVVDGAITFSKSVRKSGESAPLFANATDDGLIWLEWHFPTGSRVAEIVSAVEANVRSSPRNSKSTIEKIRILQSQS